MEIMLDTLDNTTNMIKTLETKSREYMWDHYKNRIWDLRPRRIDHVYYSDTLFSSIVSIRDYKCFQTFAFKRSTLECGKLMKRETQAHTVYEDVICEVGAPNKMMTDNANVCKG